MDRAEQRAARSPCEEDPALPVLFTLFRPTLKNRCAIFRVNYPLMIRGSSIWWRGQIDFGFWYTAPANAFR